MSDLKRSERVAVNFTERELIDLANLANDDNRPTGEMVRVIVRRYLYGRVGAIQRGGQQSMSAHQAHRVPEFADTDFADGVLRG